MSSPEYIRQQREELKKDRRGRFMVTLDHIPTRTKVPRDKCHRCGRIVWFGTKDGYLIAFDDDGSKHPCPNP